MIESYIITSCVAFFCFILAFIFYKGKGDFLIAGYNTMPEKERKKVNIHRLRLLMTIISILSGVFCIIFPFIPNKNSQYIVLTIFIAIIFFFIIIANTWAKKKWEI